MLILRVLKKFKTMLSRRQRVRVMELVILMTIGGFMEMLSVTLILPFTEVVMNSDKMNNNLYIRSLCKMLHIDSYRVFLIFLALAMAFIYIVKNLFLLFQMGIQQRFVYNNMFATQQRLLKSYLSRPYEYYLSINSGEVLRIVENDTQETFLLLASLLTLFSESVVSIVLIGTIFFITPGVTLCMAALLIGMMFLIMKVIRPIFRRLGIASQSAYANMNQWLLQSIQGIKELKIMRKEAFFENNFEKDGYTYVKAYYRRNTLGLVPRFSIEAVAMSSFFCIVAFMIYKGVQAENLLPILSGIAMAAVRLLPAVNRISQSMADISFREPMLDMLIKTLNDMPAFEKVEYLEKEELTISDFSEVTLLNISYHYPMAEENVLDNVSMNIRRGQSVGIVGASGAGKTTVVDILLGLLQPQKGEVLVNGVNIKYNMDGWLSQIGYIPQTIFILNGDVRENVAFGIQDNQIDDKDIWRALKEAALDDFVKSLPDGLSTKLGERGVRLSGGQRQRIGIARALYNNPEVLIFDEATSALDNNTEAAIINSINQLKGSRTLIIIAHRLSTIEGCEIVYRVENGKILKEKKEL